MLRSSLFDMTITVLIFEIPLLLKKQTLFHDFHNLEKKKNKKISMTFQDFYDPYEPWCKLACLKYTVIPMACVCSLPCFGNVDK